MNTKTIISITTFLAMLGMQVASSPMASAIAPTHLNSSSRNVHVASSTTQRVIVNPNGAQGSQPVSNANWTAVPHNFIGDSNQANAVLVANHPADRFQASNLCYGMDEEQVTQPVHDDKFQSSNLCYGMDEEQVAQSGNSDKFANVNCCDLFKGKGYQLTPNTADPASLGMFASALMILGLRIASRKLRTNR